MNAISRRLLLLSVAGLALASALPAMAQDQITLRMVWWGSEARTAATTEAVKLFEAAHPNIKVQVEAVPFDGYADKLSTQIAANDAPDLIQMPVELVAQLAQAGALLNLDKVDLTDLDASTTQAANLDGQQVAVASGIATNMIIANKTMFDAAGVALPDDTKWTWDDYIGVAKQISEHGPEGVFGSQHFGFDGAYLRQQGSDMYDSEGKIVIDPAHMATFLEYAKRLDDEGGSYGVERTFEEMALPLEQSASATNKAAMGLWASSQFTAVSNASGDEMIPMLLPVIPGHTPGDHMMGVGAAQYWSVSSRSQHPDEAQALLDFIVNDVEAGKALLVVRGTPPNVKVREAIALSLNPTDAKAAQYITALQPKAVAAYLPPAGYGPNQTIFRRYLGEYLFGRLSAIDAATQMTDEIKAAVGQ